MGFPGGSDGKESVRNAGDLGLIPSAGKIPWRREWLPTQLFLPVEFHGQRSLVGYGPWIAESDMTERLTCLDGILFPQEKKIQSLVTLLLFLFTIKFSYNSFLPHFFRLVMMYASQAVMSIERIYFATWLLPWERVCF